MKMIGARLIAASCLIGLIAVLLSIVRYSDFFRTWLLRVPRVGFVLYGLAGGDVPPYFDWRIFEREAEWTKPGDVFIVSGGKTGSTWLCNIVHEIRTRGNPPIFTDIYNEVPLVEFVYYPGQSMQERIEILNNASKKYSLSVYKTHLKPPMLKLRSDAKYILIVRNVEDIVASLKPFLQSHSPVFAKMWGGFPIQAGMSIDAISKSEYENYVLNDMGGGQSQLDVFVLDFLRGWWPYRNHSNIMFVHYHDLLTDFGSQLERLASFMGIHLSPDEMTLIEHRISFDFMSKHRSRFNLQHILDASKARGKVPADVFFLSGQLMDRGPSRSGIRELDDELVKKIRLRTNKVFGQKIANWVENGGEFPRNENMP